MIIAAQLTAAGWDCREPGWWTHPQRGGIVREDDGKWWRYPSDSDKLGPFATASDAAKLNEAGEKCLRMEAK